MKESHNYDHSHSHEHLKDTNNIKLTFYLNLTFAILELFVGIFSNSMALISNSIHDFGDSIILLSTLKIENFSLKPRDKRFTYGYRRFTLVGAILNSVILFIGSLLIMYGALRRIISPEPINENILMFFSVLGIIINIIGAIKVSKSNDIIGKSLKTNLMYDALSWSIILIGAIIINITGYFIIDSLLSTIIGMLMLISVIKGVKSLFNKLMQAVPDDVQLEEVIKVIESNSNVIECHDLHIWDLDGDDYIASFHIVVEDNLNETQLMEVKEKVKRELEKCKINHTTIEVDTKTQAIYNKELKR